MCGFVGYISKEDENIKKKVIKKMTDRIAHRGPDGEGFYIDKDIALGHRRLSIIDLEGGKQPLYSIDKNYVLICNGEIYNYTELKEELIRDNYKFQTKTDSEVLIYGYDKWKTDLPNHLRGMFAFVIYDRKNKTLFGARDHFGMKPFYYYKNSNEFMFGSEIKSFLENPNFKNEVNTDALKMYLIFQYSVKEETFFKNVFKLKPGHSFVYKNNKMEIQKYFDANFDKQEIDYPSIKNQVKETLEDSIKYHQITSDVEVGSYLSGGVDSSYVVSVSKPARSFSVGFDFQGFDETDMAKDLSNMLEIKNYTQKISANDFFDIMPTIMYHTDEPHANLSTVPLYFLSKLTRENVKVVLSGEGADEMFGGYPEYEDPMLLRAYLKLPLGFRSAVRGACYHLPHFPGRNTLIKYGRPFDEYYIGHGSYFEEAKVNKILKKELRNDETISDILDPYYKNIKNEKDMLTKKQYIDFKFWLPQDILLKADKMSLANSVELRCPLMDIEVFKTARKIPSKYMVRNKISKFIFRDVANEKIPEEWSKRKKCGFPVPFGKWIKEEKYYKFTKEYFNQGYAKDFFDVKHINELLEAHYAGTENNARIIYNILCFLIWYKVYFVDFKKL